MQRSPLILKVEKKLGRDIKDILKVKYVDKFKPPHKIAEDVGVDRQTIYRWFDILGIEKGLKTHSFLKRNGIESNYRRQRKSMEN